MLLCCRSCGIGSGMVGNSTKGICMLTCGISMLVVVSESMFMSCTSNGQKAHAKARADVSYGVHVEVSTEPLTFTVGRKW